MTTLTLGPIIYRIRELPLDFYGPRFYIHASRTVHSPRGFASTWGWSVDGQFATRAAAERALTTLTERSV